MLEMAMPNTSDSVAPQMSGMASQFHRRNTGCFSLEQLRDLYPGQSHQSQSQGRGSPLNPRHSHSAASSADGSPLPESRAGGGNRVVILRSPLDTPEWGRSPGSSPQHHRQQQQQQHSDQEPERGSAQHYSSDSSPRLRRTTGGGVARRISQDGSQSRGLTRLYASPPPARRAVSGAEPELRLDAEVAMQHVRGVAKSRLGQLSVRAPHRRSNSEVPLEDASEGTGRADDDDSVEIFFLDGPGKGAAHGTGEQASSLAECWPMAERGDGHSPAPGTPEAYEGSGARPSEGGSLAPAQSCPAEMEECGQARMPLLDDLRPSMAKSASVSERPLQEKPRKLKTLRSILVERDGKLQHTSSLGRRVSFNSQVEVFVYL